MDAGRRDCPVFTGFIENTTLTEWWVIVTALAAELTLVVKVKLEMLLNMYLSRQLLRVVGLLGQAQ